MNFKDITNKIDSDRMMDSIPERMRAFEYIKMDAILDIDVTVTDYQLYESKDTNKYNVNNVKGVHIIVEMDGKTYRTSTHGKRIVSTFEYLEKSGGIKEPIATAFIRVPLNNGQSMLEFKY